MDKQAGDHAREAGAVGLGGLTARELAFGAFNAGKKGALFEFLPDPLEAVCCPFVLLLLKLVDPVGRLVSSLQYITFTGQVS